MVREFERLRGAAEAKAQEVRRLQEELQAVSFSQESKAGRLLMAKCRALQACAPLPPHARLAKPAHCLLTSCRNACMSCR